MEAALAADLITAFFFALFGRASGPKIAKIVKISGSVVMYVMDDTGFQTVYNTLLPYMHSGSVTDLRSAIRLLLLLTLVEFKECNSGGPEMRCFCTIRSGLLIGLG